jgi:catechol 2,3-dioxygenase-like lactoylglutathione lyase family enzyme
MSQNPMLTFSHIGICVSDLARSERFYAEALGFVRSHSVEAGPPFDVVSELPGLKLRASFLKRDGITIELLYHEHPVAVGSPERRPMNQLGLTHLAFTLDDISLASDRIVRHGGRIHPQTRVSTPVGDFMFCTDPDGTRIELWQKAA